MLGFGKVTAEYHSVVETLDAMFQDEREKSPGKGPLVTVSAFQKIESRLPGAALMAAKYFFDHLDKGNVFRDRLREMVLHPNHDIIGRSAYDCREDVFEGGGAVILAHKPHTWRLSLTTVAAVLSESQFKSLVSDILGPNAMQEGEKVRSAAAKHNAEIAERAKALEGRMAKVDVMAAGLAKAERVRDALREIDDPWAHSTIIDAEALVALEKELAGYYPILSAAAIKSPEQLSALLTITGSFGNISMGNNILVAFERVRQLRANLWDFLESPKAVQAEAKRRRVEDLKAREAEAAEAARRAKAEAERARKELESMTN